MTFNADELEIALAKFESANDALAEQVGDLEAEREVCLCSRTAYTRFHSLCVLDNTLLEWAAQRLRKELTCARDRLTIPKYLDSVTCRSTSFENFCEQIVSFDDENTHIPQLAGEPE